MANESLFLFRREALQKLLDAKTEYIVIRANLVEATLQDGTQAGVMKVQAEAVASGAEEPVTTVEGCPIPPCRPK